MRRSLTSRAAGIQQLTSVRNMEGIPRLEPLKGTDWLTQLPEDVLSTVVALLDLPTLYTIRLVCKCLRKCGAGHFKALDCTILDEPPPTDFTQFSSVAFLAVTVSHQSHLRSLAHPRMAPFVTHVSVKGFHLRDRQATEELEAVLILLPKLRSLSLLPLADERVRGGAGYSGTTQCEGVGRGRASQGRGVGRAITGQPLGEGLHRLEAGQIPAGGPRAPGRTAQAVEGDPHRAGAKVTQMCAVKGPGPESSAQPLGGFSRLPLFPPRLEELKIQDNLRRLGCGVVGDASPLTRCSQLTRLDLDLGYGAGISTGSLSSLRNLRSLSLRSCSSVLGLLSTFTALTSLTLDAGSREDDSVFGDIGRLTGLSRLALTGLSFTSPLVQPFHLTCIGQLTNLTCLDLSGCMLGHSVQWSTALVPLTRLVSVQFSCDPGQMPHLSSPQAEALCSLSLVHVSNTSRQVCILSSATRLTHLHIWHRQNLLGWCPALTRMVRLRSLSLIFNRQSGNLGLGSADDELVFRLNTVLRACTMLTKLDYRWGALRPDSDLDACAALPGLRSLSFRGIPELTPAWLPALQAMSGLTELSLDSTGICVTDMTPDVIAAFDAERRQLGWPLLNLRVEEENGRCLERLAR